MLLPPRGVWEAAGAGELVQEQDAVMSPPGSSMWYQNRSGSVLDVRHCVTPMPVGTNPHPKPQWDREEGKERLSCSLDLR